MLVILALILAELGPLRSLTSSRSKGSIGGTFNSGIPSFSLGLNKLTESIIQFARLASVDLHTLIYGAEKKIKKYF